MKKILFLSFFLSLSAVLSAQVTTVKLTSVQTDLLNNRGWSQPKYCNYNLYIKDKITFIKGDGEHIFTIHSKKETYEKEKYNVFTLEASSVQDGECIFRFIFGKYEKALIIEYKNKPREMYHFEILD